MKSEIESILIIIAFCLVVAGFFCMCDAKHSDDLWNDGYCFCGGQWEYEQAVGHRWSTTYIYRCDKCGYMIEISDYRQNDKTEEERIQRVISYGVSSEGTNS